MKNAAVKPYVINQQMLQFFIDQTENYDYDTVNKNFECTYEKYKSSTFRSSQKAEIDTYLKNDFSVDQKIVVQRISIKDGLHDDSMLPSLKNSTFQNEKNEDKLCQSASVIKLYNIL